MNSFTIIYVNHPQATESYIHISINNSPQHYYQNTNEHFNDKLLENENIKLNEDFLSHTAVNAEKAIHDIQCKTSPSFSSSLSSPSSTNDSITIHTELHVHNNDTNTTNKLTMASSDRFNNNFVHTNNKNTNKNGFYNTYNINTANSTKFIDDDNSQLDNTKVVGDRLDVESRSSGSSALSNTEDDDIEKGYSESFVKDLNETSIKQIEISNFKKNSAH